MDDRYIKIRKDILWRVIVVLIIVILAVLLVFQICDRIEEKKESEYTPVEYVDVTYEHLTSEMTNNEDCYICGNHEMSLMPYYRKFDTLGIISLTEWYVIDLGLKEYDEVGKEMPRQGSTSMRNTNLDTVKFSTTSTSSRGMASAKITPKDGSTLNTKELEENLCADCLSKVAEALEHPYKKGEEKEETIPLCLIDFETLELHSMQGLYTGYFVRDYWVEFNFTDEYIELDAYYLPVRE